MERFNWGPIKNRKWSCSEVRQMWRRHERGQVRVGRGYNGTGEVLLNTDITPAVTLLL